MKLRQVLGLSALVVTLGVAFGAQAQAQYEPSSGSGEVSDSRVTPGECLTFSGDGFAPDSPVEVTDNGSPVATDTADATGEFSTEVCPEVRGVHILRGRGVTPDGAVRTVTARVVVAGRRLSATGTSSTVPALLLGLGLVATGSGAVALGRRRRKQTA